MYIVEKDREKRESIFKYSNSLLNQSFNMVYINLFYMISWKCLIEQISMLLKN